jgi:hypothetical protein
MMRAVLDEAAGVTHRIVRRLNAAAMVAIHERIERITPELLTVQRLEPARVLAAKRTAHDGQSSDSQANLDGPSAVMSASRVAVVPEEEARS